MKHEINIIQSKYHSIGSYRINKVSWCSYDDKKCILKDTVGYHIFIYLIISQIKINYLKF